MSSARYLAKLGNETTTGHISSATATVWDGNVPLVRSGDLAWCDECEDNFEICGTYTGFWEDGHFVGDGDQVLCNCDDNYVIAFSGFFGERQPGITPASGTQQAKPAVSAGPVQYAQTAKATPAPILKAPPAALALPARIYTTQRIMDDYNAKDMHYGDLSEEVLKESFGLTDVSAKVNPYTLTLAPSAPASPYGGFYPGSLTESQPVVVSREESARLMFNEFRELAKVFSFQGPYKSVITKMIDHMQGNSGRPYSNPLLDKALKEQILNDHSENSTLLKIKDVISSYVDSEYSLYPLEYKDKFRVAIGEHTVLPKFDRSIDRTNGLVITVHDTWATYITLESLEVTGDSYRAKVHYRIQDHFGLDDTDILNSVYREGRIFRIWFVLQRYVKYGYRPFITEMNATVEISGRRGE